MRGVRTAQTARKRTAEARRVRVLAAGLIK